MAEAIDMMYCVQCDLPRKSEVKQDPIPCPKCKSNLVHTKVGWQFAQGRAIFTAGSLIGAILIGNLAELLGKSWQFLFTPLTALSVGLLVIYWAYYFCGFGSMFLGDEEARTFRSAFYRRWPIENIPAGYSRPALKQQLIRETKAVRNMLIPMIVILILYALVSRC